MSADEEPLKHITFSAYGINIYNIFLLYQHFTFESLKSLKKKKKKKAGHLVYSFDLLKNYCQTHSTLYFICIKTAHTSEIINYWSNKINIQ